MSNFVSILIFSLLFRFLMVLNPSAAANACYTLKLVKY